MPDPCEHADIRVLLDIGRDLADQIALYARAERNASKPAIRTAIEVGEETRKSLLREINAKLHILGAPEIAAARKTPIDSKTKEDDGAAIRTYLAINGALKDEQVLRDKIRAAVASEGPCAHTCNFLQTVLSRLENTSAYA